MLLQSLKEHLMATLHPHKTEEGRDVIIERPTTPSNKDYFHDSSRTAVVTPLSDNVPKSLNGIDFKKFDATGHDWNTDKGINKSLSEPKINLGHSTKRIATGIIMKEPDGRYWIHEPTNHFAYTEHSFPKGKLDDGLSYQANAIKETFEETGLKAKILKHIGDVERTTSIARYYLGERTSGHPAHMGWESQSVKLVPKEKLKDYLNLKLDHDLVDKLDKTLSESIGDFHHPMIKVDGLSKHRTNSLGNPIHHTDEGIVNFHRWFGDSKVTDEHGRPLVVYHGTGHDFHEFSNDKTGLANDYGYSGRGHYFMNDPEWASGYAEVTEGSHMHVKPSYLKMENPLIISGGSETGIGLPSKEEAENYTKHLKKSGYDGVITFGNGHNIDEYMVHEPHQIKSVFNKGGFDKSNNIVEALDKKIPKTYFNMYGNSHRPSHEEMQKNNDFSDRLARKDEKEVQDDPYTIENAPAALGRYTDGSIGYNEPLWHNKFYKTPINENIKDLNAIIKTKKIKSNIHVYVGVKNLKIGDGIVHIPQFLSSSTHPEIAADFSNEEGTKHILRIKVPKGTHGIAAQHFSNVDTEHEVIFPANNLLKVHHKPNIYENHSFGGTDTYHIHDAEFMSDDDIESHKKHPEVKSYLRMKELLK